ncbi:HUL5 [Candida theae]|uniref:HECT-type E3 ubiquitin transferase n=1 Tax=Candida theae TaxID=1198502 RepID=A0AAD5BHM8_9ASCO|nr:HUL5 [Candida theae]KAI5962733.1 HUL5 [Candida theae]
MFNFTGDTKRRNVNLGDKKRTGFGGFGTNAFLEQSRKEREEREQQRIRENAAITIQRAIRSYLQQKEEVGKLLRDWLDSDTSEVDLWGFVSQFVTLTHWFGRRGESDQEELSEIVSKLNSELETKWSNLSSEHAAALFYLGQFVSGCLSQTKVERQIKRQWMSIIRALHGKYHYTSAFLLAQLGQYLQSELYNEGHSEEIVDILNFAYTVEQSLLNTNRSSFEPSMLNILACDVYTGPNEFYLKVLREFASKKQSEIDKYLKENDAAKDRLLYMLVNFLIIHENAVFTMQDLQLVHVLLKYSQSMVLENYPDESESQQMKDRGMSAVVLPTAKIEVLKSLYAPGFLQNVLKSGQQNNTISYEILSKLIALQPSWKQSVLNQICIDPTNIFKTCAHFLKQAGELSGRSFEKVEEAFLSGDFYNGLLFFEEVYSYWLIVSNDTESFKKTGIDEEVVKEFCKFLKPLCSCLAMKADLGTKYLRQKTFTLVDQLYLKNLRLKFLPPDFWLVKQRSYNFDKLLSYVIQDFMEDSVGADDDDDNREREAFLQSIPNTYREMLILLKHVPYFIPFNDRVRIFQQLVEIDSQSSSPYWGFMEPRVKAEIRRQNLLQDAFEAFSKMGNSFKNRIQVEFFNEYGPEAGIDGGGITKEFLTSVVKEGFDPAQGLFKETRDNQIYPNEEICIKMKLGQDVYDARGKLEYIQFMGMCVGKCLYENVLIDVSFAPFFINKWCMDGFKNTINDLSYLDGELFKNLIKLSNMSSEELQHIDLVFAIDEKVDDETVNFELIPNGRSLKVDKSNVQYYLHKFADFKLNQLLLPQTKAFLSGLFTIIPRKWFMIFDYYELQMLISGGKKDVDVNDWQENVEYGGYLPDDVSIQQFWEIVDEMTPQEKSKLIKFVTSVSRAPLLGFSVLNPKFGIRNSGRDVTRLPTASTCVNLLKLPDYQDKQIMREKLLYAINTESGFDLS